MRLLLGEVIAGRLSPMCYERTITRLGGGVHIEKGLTSEAMERTLLALRGFADLLSTVNVTNVRAVGTQALRQAVNGPAFACRVQAELGLPLQIIDGVEEARLSARGVAEGLSPQPERYLAFDIGGGSTEFIYCEHKDIRFSKSYPLGVVSLAESGQTLDELNEGIHRHLDAFLNDATDAGVPIADLKGDLIGTAGTVTTIAAMDLQMVHYDWRRINNHRIDRQRVLSFIDQLRPLSASEREEWPGMEKGRGDLIVPGLLIVAAIMQRLNQPVLAVSDFGLLEGALLTLADTANSN